MVTCPLFGVIPGPDFASADALLAKMRPYIDGVELRLDTFKLLDMQEVQAFLKRCGLPVMFTLRREDQGGSFIGTEDERLNLLCALCELGPQYIDLEYDIPTAFRKPLYEAHPTVQLISSYHDFSGTPGDLEGVLAKMRNPYTHIYKIAVMAHSSHDALRLLHFIKAYSDAEQIIGISMGPEGQFTRILAPVAGSNLTYASAEEASASAPGQITAREMQEIYRFKTLNRQTAVYGLIGDPVEKSLGHRIHNAVFEKTDKNAVYVKMRVTSQALPAFLPMLKQLSFHGISVTMPLKEAILPLLSTLSPQTQEIGACNTVKITPDEMAGFNTDGVGALNAIEKKGPVKGKHIVMIGAGGAAKGIAYEAVQRGAKVTILNRTAEKAVEMAASVGGRGGGFDQFPETCASGYDVLINCTPAADIQDEWILPETIAMDIVYVPKNTPFLLQASRKKCRLVYGYEMFIYQALEQLRIWFPEGIDCKKALAAIENCVANALIEA